MPITPSDDSGVKTPTRWRRSRVERNGAVVAQTQAVVPVSWEISCDICHNTRRASAWGGTSCGKHDALHATHLETPCR